MILRVQIEACSVRSIIKNMLLLWKKEKIENNAFLKQQPNASNPSVFLFICFYFLVLNI